MTAPTYNSNLLMSGTREFGQVTNTFGGYLQSGGVAYTLTTPWQADMFEWWRYTAYGTAGTIGQGVWFYGFPAGDELAQRAIADNGVTGNLNLVLETTNGITIANTTGGFTNEHLTITGVSTATPAVVTTSASHGLTSGMRVYITQLAGAVGSILNNKEYVVQVLSATTFSLYDVYGAPIPNIGTYTSGGQVTIEGPDLGVQDAPIVYKLTLGTQVMGADNDVIYFRATKFNSYFNFGDVA